MVTPLREWAGALGTLLTLKVPSQSLSSGNAAVTWTSQGDVWAEMEAIGGTVPGLTMEADYRFTLRYRSDVTPRWRLEIAGSPPRVFAIVRPPQDPDGRRVQLVIFAKEVLA